MSTTAKRLFGPAQLTGVAATKYTTPASTKTIIRQIHVQNPSANAVGFTMSIGADAAGTRIYDAFSIAAAAPGQLYSVLDVPCYYVLDAGDVVQAFASSPGVLTLTLNGQELTPG